MPNENDVPVNPALVANNPVVADFVEEWTKTYSGKSYDLAGNDKAKYDIVEGVGEIAKHAAVNGISATLSVSTNADGVTRVVMDVVPRPAG